MRWLTTTARRRALDRLRRDRTLRSKLPLLIEPEPAALTDPDGQASETAGGGGG